MGKKSHEMEVSAAQHHECVETERSWWRGDSPIAGDEVQCETDCLGSTDRLSRWLTLHTITHFIWVVRLKLSPSRRRDDKTTTDHYYIGSVCSLLSTARSGPTNEWVRQEHNPPTFGWNIRDGNCAVALTTILMNRSTYCLARRRTISLSNSTFPLFKRSIVALFVLWIMENVLYLNIKTEQIVNQQQQNTKCETGNWIDQLF